MANEKVMPLPGEETAKSLGYTLHHHSGDRVHASYVKDGVFLDVWHPRIDATTVDAEMLCELSFNKAWLTVSTGEMSFPNRNFSSFEKQIMRANAKLSEAE